jgi:glycosyltransferase involved in cell wall biosynthesis
MKTRLRILLTNNELAGRGGSELFLRDVALGLLRRGHNPVAFSLKLGDFAQELERATIPVVDDLDALGTAPDVIHGQHHLEAVTAMLRFPKTPAIYFCHGWLPWQERPPVFPSIARYIAVDDLCQERLLTTFGIQQKQTSTLYNFVDLARFRPRPSLPKKPRTALIFSNVASDGNYAGIIRAACHAVGIEKVDIRGGSSGNVSLQPEKDLPYYDVVFAKARCALEAMAVGCAVVVTEYQGLAGLVTRENVAELRRLNFGVRTVQAAPLTEAGVIAALARYCPDDAAAVSDWIRAEADLETYLDRLEAFYLAAVQNASNTADTTEQSLLAASNYLKTLTPLVKRQAADAWRAAHAESQVQFLTGHIQQLESELHNWRSEQLRWYDEQQSWQVEREHWQVTQSQWQVERKSLEQAALSLNQIQRSRSWSLILALHRIKHWLGVDRLLKRCGMASIP